MENLFINFNSEPLKALGNNRFGGYLVRFGDATKPDLTGDYFTKNTDFFVEDGASLPVLFEHGLDPVLKRRKIGKGTIKTDEVGVWFETQLEKRDKYEKAIIELARQNKLGYSSGAAGHMVSRKQVGGASEILEWGLAEGSFVTTPAEPRNSVVALKSYQPAVVEFEEPSEGFKSTELATRLNSIIDDLTDNGRSRVDLIKSIAKGAVITESEVQAILSGEVARPSDARLKVFARVLDVDLDALKSLANKDAACSIEGIYDAALESGSDAWRIFDAYSTAIKRIADLSRSSRLVGNKFDASDSLRKATDHLCKHLTTQSIEQIDAYTMGDDAEFYLKAIINPDSDLLSTVAVDLEQHSNIVVAALKGILSRFRKNHEARQSQKAGRVLSQRNRDRLMALIQEMQNLLDDSMPMASETDMNAAKTAHLQSLWRAKQLGVNYENTSYDS